MRHVSAVHLTLLVSLNYHKYFSEKTNSQPTCLHHKLTVSVHISDGSPIQALCGQLSAGCDTKTAKTCAGVTCQWTH